MVDVFLARKREVRVGTSLSQLLVLLDVADEGTTSLHCPVNGNGGKYDLHQMFSFGSSSLIIECVISARKTKAYGADSSFRQYI